MRFAHMSDVHLGSWSGHPDLKEMACAAFDRAIDICIYENLDFILISGDLFDTSLPSFDVFNRAVSTLRKAHSEGIAIYAIPGSHDFSPTGRTYINILESAGLLVNVAKAEEVDGKLKLQFTVDKKTGTKITGMMGRMGALEKNYFMHLDRSIEQEDGFKIFMFHSGIEEYKPPHLKDMTAVPLSSLPKGFDYYAAGHIHQTAFMKEDMGIIAFPGCLYPTDFKEMERYESGFYIIDYDGKLKHEFRKVSLHEVSVLNVNADGKGPDEIERNILAGMPHDLSEKILVIRVEGVMNGKPSDIDFKRIYNAAVEHGALSVKRNTLKLSVKEFESVAVGRHENIEEIERRIIQEHVGKMKLGSHNVELLILALMKALDDEKQEGETNYVFAERLKNNALKTLGLTV